MCVWQSEEKRESKCGHGEDLKWSPQTYWEIKRELQISQNRDAVMRKGRNSIATTEGFGEHEEREAKETIFLHCQAKGDNA